MYSGKIIVFICTLLFIKVSLVAQNTSAGDNTFLIPEIGMEVQFPSQPRFSKGMDKGYLGYFSTCHSYEGANDYYLDTIAFALRVGAYYNENTSDTIGVHTKGLKALRNMVQFDKTLKIILDEATQFHGLPARRFKVLIGDENPLVLSMITFAMGPYFIELQIYDPSIPGMEEKVWKNRPFFQSISFTHPMPARLLRESRADSDSCELFPCYLEEQQMVAYFPAAPLIIRGKLNSETQVTKYLLAPFEQEQVLVYGLEFYEGKQPLGTLTDSAYISMFLKSSSALLKVSEEEKLISSRPIKFQGKPAMDLHTSTTLPPNPDGIQEIDIHSRIFIHQGRVVRMFTYRKAGMLENYPAICFFDWMVFL